MITIRDVARQAGVSVATVSRVLNNSALVSPDTRENVMKAVTQLGYRPNANAQALAKKLNGQIVAIKAKAGQGGRLFGSVTSKDIAAALTQKVGEPVDKRKIVLDGDIKNFGSYEVEVKVYPKVTAKLTVKVEE